MEMSGRYRYETKLIFHKLAAFECITEGAALLELALWKAKMESSCSAKENFSDAEFRSQCRLNCGIDTVMHNVLPFVLPEMLQETESDDENIFDPEDL